MASNANTRAPLKTLRQNASRAIDTAQDEYLTACQALSRLDGAQEALQSTRRTGEEYITTANAILTEREATAAGPGVGGAMYDTITQAVKEATEMAVRGFTEHLATDEAMGQRIEAATLRVTRAKEKLATTKAEFESLRHQFNTMMENNGGRR
ncbi:Ff.00g039940.m01.CDS01 [Fusarium sp. VM40]|nr:Ff.00g039940.m01.CDS01 [Fusarium sp. VM40]